MLRWLIHRNALLAKMWLLYICHKHNEPVLFVNGDDTINFDLH